MSVVDKAEEELVIHNFEVLRFSRKPLLIATDVNYIRFIVVKHRSKFAVKYGLKKIIDDLEKIKYNSPGFCRFEIWVKGRKKEFNKVLL